jgi:serine/threonine-protein kinase
MASELPTSGDLGAPSSAEAPTGSVSGLGAPAGSGSGPIGEAGAPTARGGGGPPLRKICPTCHARYPSDFKVCPRDASPLGDAPDDHADPLLGMTLGDAYRIVRMVGEGGMGRVYEARHTRLGNKRFAVKMLHAEYARQPDVVARFQREAEAASGITHPNVVDVYDVHHTDDGLPYMVGEFLEGEEFGDFLERTEKISVPLAVRIVRQLCRALGAAHARGVVHRDMKPENVFLVGNMRRPRAKIIDFGISKVGDAGGTALTRTGMIMGTPSYMAPEQARGDKVDHRADIYAVGGILYRALTGKKPFDGDDPSVTLAQVLTEDPARPRSREPKIPQALELVIQKAMAKSPADRHQSMAELDADLLPFDEDPEDASEPSIATASTDPVEASAKTLLVGNSPTHAGAARTNLWRATREATMARPMIVLLTIVAYLWLVAGLIDALAGIVRVVRGPQANLTRVETVLISVGSFLATVTPLIAWIRYLAQRWNNSVRALQLSDGMRRVTAATIATSGIAALAVRLIEVIGRGQAADIAWPIWSPLLFGTSVLAGGLAVLSLRMERNR